MSAGGRIVPGAVVRFAGRRLRTGASGVVRVRHRFARPGRLTVTASKPGFASAAARLRVLPPRRR